MGGKSERTKQERDLRLFCLLGGIDGLSRSTTFFRWSRHGPCHWWSRIDGERGCCWLFWIVFVVGVSELSKVLDCRYRLPGILFFEVVFPQNQVVEPWYLTCCWLFGINRAILNAINLVLLIVASLKLEIQLCIIHLHFLRGILFQQGYMKDVVNPPFLKQFELVSLFTYWV